VQAAANCLLERDGASTGEDADRGQQRPEEALAPITQWVAGVGCSRAGENGDHEEDLNSDIGDVGERLRDDGGRTGDDAGGRDRACLEDCDCERQVDRTSGAQGGTQGRRNPILRVATSSRAPLVNALI
jgi:hypothetical protein